MGCGCGKGNGGRRSGSGPRNKAPKPIAPARKRPPKSSGENAFANRLRDRKRIIGIQNRRGLK